jgi:hypothetical protein
VVEGVQESLWVLKNPEEFDSNPVIKDYLEESRSLVAAAEKEAQSAKNNASSALRAKQ